MLDRGSIISAIASTGKQYNVKGSSLWLQCPYHKNGQETTPSLKINLEGGQYPPGNWTCFGCSPKKSGSWKKLAVKLGLRNKDDDEDSPYAAALDENSKAKFLGEEEETNLLHSMLEKEPIIQKSVKWRGINGWLLHELGARVSMLSSAGTTINTSRVYLPVHVNGKWEGGIFCSWTENSTIKYENEKHDSKRILFPYDYVKKKLAALPKKDRKICMVEGPRDALNLLQYDILALANLGGDTVWSQEKSELLMDLNLTALVLATDPDDVGNTLASIIKRQLGSAISRISRFKMEIKYSESGRVIWKEDPGNLSYPRIKYLQAKMDGLE